MAVTNTVQGLNCVIDLLKNILDATKSNDDKTVQPRDVSSTSRVTANIQSPAIETEGLNSLNSINKGIENKAKSYVSIIKTITSKDTVSGIKTLASLQGLGVLTMFNKAIDTIVNSLNLLNNMKVSKANVTNFVTVINSITNIITAFTDIIFSIGKVMLAAVGLGALFIIAWPMILLGFAGVAATAIGVLGIIKLMVVVQTFLFGSAPGSTLKNAAQAIIFKQMTEIFLYLGAIMVVAAGVGLLAEYAGPYIMSGIAWMAGVMLGIMGIMFLANMVSKNVMFGVVSIGIIIASLYAVSLLIFIAAGVGVFTENFYDKILIGFGAIASVMVGVALIMALVKLTEKFIVSSKVVSSIALLIGTLLLASLLVTVSIEVGKVVMDNFRTVMIGLGSLAGMVVALSIVMSLIGKLTDFAGAGSVLKGIGLIILMVGVLSVTSFMIKGVINLENDVKAGGGWTTIWKTIGMIGGVVGALLTVAGLLGASKSIALAIAIGLGLIGGITLILLGLSKVIRNVVDTAIIINEAREKNAFDGIENAARSIGSAISTLVKELLPASWRAVLLFPAITPLNMLMNTISKFVRIVSKFGKDPNAITPVEVDENGKVISTGEKTNIGQIAQNIAIAFSVFLKNLSDGLKSADIEGLKHSRKVSRLMNRIINPISKFAEVIVNVGNNPNFINDPKTGKPKADIIQIGTNIANVFVNLVKIIDDNLKNIEISRGKIKKLAKMEGVVNAIGGTLELLTKYKVAEDGKSITIIDENGKSRTHIIDFSGIGTVLKDLNTNLGGVNISNIEDFSDWAGKDISSSSIWTILNKVEMFDADSTALEKNAANVKIFQEEWTKLDNIMFKDSKNKLKALKEYKETMAELCKVLKEMSESTEKISQMTLPNVNTTNNSNGGILDRVFKKENTSTAVDSQNNNAVNNVSQQQPINSSEIADAIKSGLTGSIVKLSFRDSTEDFVADLMLS